MGSFVKRGERDLPPPSKYYRVVQINITMYRMANIPIIQHYLCLSKGDRLKYTTHVNSCSHLTLEFEIGMFPLT